METPKVETPSKKGEGGCMFFIVRGSIGVAIILAIDYVTTWIFQSAYPHDEITKDLIPFQNHYLATTDAFLTSEGVSTEITDDPGAAARFLSRCIFPFVGVFVLFIIVSVVPFLKKLTPYMIHTMVFAMILLMIDSLFFPPVLTEFDRERRVMIVHEPEWMLFDNKNEIPFSQISGFDYVIEQVDGNDFEDEVVNADLYAITPKGKVFIGENQLIRYYHDHDHMAKLDEDSLPISKEMKLEIARTIEALQRLIK